MAFRKIIFTIPDRQLIEACAEANANTEVKEIEAEFDALMDGIVEPWENSQAR